ARFNTARRNVRMQSLREQAHRVCMRRRPLEMVFERVCDRDESADVIGIELAERALDLDELAKRALDLDELAKARFVDLWEVRLHAADVIRRAATGPEPASQSSRDPGFAGDRPRVGQRRDFAGERCGARSSAPPVLEPPNGCGSRPTSCD